MNNTLNNSSIISLETSPIIKLIDQILTNYIIRLVSGTGVILNISSLILLKDKKLKHPIYDHLWCRGLCNLIACIFGTANLLFYPTGTEQSFEMIFITYYVVGIPMRIAFLASAFSELSLILNRLAVVRNKPRINPGWHFVSLKVRMQTKKRTVAEQVYTIFLPKFTSTSFKFY
jgi:hypothetical protein